MSDASREIGDARGAAMSVTDALVEISWPLAIVIAAIASVIIVWRITSKSSSFEFGFKDWFNLKSGANVHEGEASTQVASEQNETVNPPSKKQALSTLGDVDADSEVDPVPKHIVLANSAAELEDIFEGFRETESYKGNPDFWHSYYISQKHEYGVADEESEFKKLAAQNPDWVWPQLYLVRRYMRLHDADSALNALDLAMSRATEVNRTEVLREAIRMYGKLFSYDRAFRFFIEQMQGGANDKQTATMLRTLAEIGPDKSLFDNILLREIAHSLENNKRELFDIAFAYGEAYDTKMVSFERYRELCLQDSNGSSAANNMGVIVDHDATIEVEYFERAIAAADPMGFANLARILSSAGYVARAEQLLANAPDTDLSPIAEAALADARSKVGMARKKLDAEIEGLESHAKEQDTKFKSLIFAGFSYLRKSGEFGIEGAFASDDKDFAISSFGDVKMAAKIGDDSFFGVLTKRGLCYEGRLEKKGASLLSLSSFRAVAVRVAVNEVRVILLPTGFSRETKSRVISLERLEFDDSGQTEVSSAGALGLLESH